MRTKCRICGARDNHDLVRKNLSVTEYACVSCNKVFGIKSKKRKTAKFIFIVFEFIIISAIAIWIYHEYIATPVD